MRIQVKNVYIFTTYNEWIDGILSVSLTPDDKYIIAGSWDKIVKVFDLQTKQQIHSFQKNAKGEKKNFFNEWIFFRVVWP